MWLPDPPPTTPKEIEADRRARILGKPAGELENELHELTDWAPDQRLREIRRMALDLVRAIDTILP